MAQGLLLRSNHNFTPVTSLQAITSTTSVYLDVQGDDLEIMHIIRNGSTGAYCSLKLCDMTPEDALATRPIGIKVTADSGLARATNVVTVNTSTAHGLVVGDAFVITGSTPDGATTFDGEFTVASVTDSDTFTFAQTAANDTGGGGYLYRLKESAHLGEGTNIKAANVSSGVYVTRFKGCHGIVRLTCNVNATNGGTNDVLARTLTDGLVQ